MSNQDLGSPLPEPVISVIYTPDCKCPVEQFVILDNFPMHQRFLTRCPNCDRGCLMEITDPIVFHVNQGKDFSIEQLKEMKFGETWQKDYLERYKKF